MSFSASKDCVHMHNMFKHNMQRTSTVMSYLWNFTNNAD